MTKTKKKKIIIAAVCTLAAVAIATTALFMFKKFKSNDNSDQKVYVEQVSMCNTAQDFSLSGGCFSGVVETQDKIEVKFDSSKKIKEIYVKIGDAVKKDAPLFKYDVESMELEMEQGKLDIQRMQNTITDDQNQKQQLQTEKAKASADAQVSFTTQILSLESEIAKLDYDIKVKNAELTKLQNSIDNAEVKATIDGTIKSVQDIDSLESSGSDVLITIMSTGDYKIKGTINEQNIGSVSADMPVIIRSRVDDSKTWSGVISSIDTNPQENTNNQMYSEGGNEEGTSSKYAFYVKPDSFNGLMLGQHVIIEPDFGQGENIDKEGIWLYSDYVIADGDKSFVWVKGKKDRLEKRYVEIGQTDEINGDCEISSGLSDDDYIAYPDETYEEGMTAVIDIEDVTPDENNDSDTYDNADSVVYDDNVVYDEGSAVDAVLPTE